MSPYNNNLSVEPLDPRILLANDVFDSLTDSGATLSSRPENLVHFGEHTYFDARPGAEGTGNTESTRQIFRTNGSSRGTDALLPRPSRLDSYALTEDRLVFISGNELHATDELGVTHKLDDVLRPGDYVGEGGIHNLVSLGNGELLAISGSAVGELKELRWTDGYSVKQLELPFANSRPQLLGVMSNEAWFADNGILWSTGGDKPFVRGVGAPNFVEIRSFAAASNMRGGADALFFEASTQPSPDVDPIHGFWRLYSYQESPALISSETGISDQLIIGSHLYYVAYTEESGRELRRILWTPGRRGEEDTLPGPELVADLAPGAQSSNPEFLTEYDSTLLFAADGKLFLHDPDDSSTRLIHTFDGHTTSFGPRWLTVWNDRVYFVADDGQGEELWSTDGTSSGTQLVADIVPGPVGSSPNSLTPAGNELHFTARTTEHGEELWAIDANDNARLVRDIRREQSRIPRSISDLTLFRDAAYFRFNDGEHGTELWRTDGSDAGTWLVKDIRPGEPGGSPRDLMVVGDWLYFTANDGQHGYELWRTDGTPAGTNLMLDLYPGSEGSVPTGLSEVNGEIWFDANLSSRVNAIHRVDGTPEGTAVVVEVDRIADPPIGNVRGVLNTTDSIYVWTNQVADNLNIVDQLGRGRLRNLNAAAHMPLAVGDNLFFIDNDRGLVSAAGSRLISLDRSVLKPEDPADDSLMTGFNEQLYYVTRAGVYRTDGRSDPVKTPLPVDSRAIAANGDYLFAWNIPTRRGQAQSIYALDRSGDASEIFGGDKQLIQAKSDPLGLAFVLRDDGGNELWYSDGSPDGTRMVESIPGTGTPTEILRAAGQLLFVADNGAGAQTVWTVPLPIHGDLNADSRIDASDVEILYAAIRTGSTDEQMDLNGDDSVDPTDVDFLVENLARTQQGDLNFDRRVQFDDFLHLSANFGRDDLLYGDGDLNGDGVIGFDDFLLLASNFGFEA